MLLGLMFSIRINYCDRLDVSILSMRLSKTTTTEAIKIRVIKMTNMIKAFFFICVASVTEIVLKQIRLRRNRLQILRWTKGGQLSNKKLTGLMINVFGLRTKLLPVPCNSQLTSPLRKQACPLKQLKWARR